MRRSIPQGLELDDNRERIDVAAVHAFLSTESYWARDRTLEQVKGTIDCAARVIGCYDGEEMIGFARVDSDRTTTAYLVDVYVLPAYRGHGVGTELVREAVENGPERDLCWRLQTTDAHGLYARFGFGPVEGLDDRYMGREAKA